MPNRISLTGHTDTTPYSAQAGYTNWELSADRANAARRALGRGGLAADRVARVVGLSSSVLFDKVQPRNPINRRISIIVMTKRAEEAALKTDVPVGPGGAPVEASGATAGADAGVAASVRTVFSLRAVAPAREARERAAPGPGRGRRD